MTKNKMIDYLTTCNKKLFGTAEDKKRLQRMKKSEVYSLYRDEIERGEFEELMINTHTSPEDWA